MVAELGAANERLAPTATPPPVGQSGARVCVCVFLGPHWLPVDLSVCSKARRRRSWRCCCYCRRCVRQFNINNTGEHCSCGPGARAHPEEEWRRRTFGGAPRRLREFTWPTRRRILSAAPTLAVLRELCAFPVRAVKFVFASELFAQIRRRIPTSVCVRAARASGRPNRTGRQSSLAMAPHLRGQTNK